MVLYIHSSPEECLLGSFLLFAVILTISTSSYRQSDYGFSSVPLRLPWGKLAGVGCYISWIVMFMKHYNIDIALYSKRIVNWAQHHASLKYIDPYAFLVLLVYCRNCDSIPDNRLFYHTYLINKPISQYARVGLHDEPNNSIGEWKLKKSDIITM